VSWGLGKSRKNENVNFLQGSLLHLTETRNINLLYLILMQIQGSIFIFLDLCFLFPTLDASWVWKMKLHKQPSYSQPWRPNCSFQERLRSSQQWQSASQICPKHISIILVTE
jgi:hypothetical protein